MSSLTAAQQAAVQARGNVLVSAAAGTGKTSTLTVRVLHCLRTETPRASLEEILVVTFTDAAAAEMRHRIREQLEAAALASPDDAHWPEQLALFDAAHIGTLHGFCLQLARRHFHALGLDPQFRVMSEAESFLLAADTLDALFQRCYEGKTKDAEAVRRLIQVQAGGREQEIRKLVLKLHEHTQTRPDPAGWFEKQLAVFAEAGPELWCGWLRDALCEWRRESLTELAALAADNVKAAECLACLKALPEDCEREEAAKVLAQLQAVSKIWPSKLKGKLEKPLKPFFADVDFLLSVARTEKGKDPLAEDWDWTREPVTALLRLAQEFAAEFVAAKRAAGLADFHDLEQFALALLWDFAKDTPTDIARQWRGRLRFVFVDEYQDINAAQDKIIVALSRDGADANRFLVGDVKQSIYRFRQADPKIFRSYTDDWCKPVGQTLALTENFRSREGVLEFVNSLFTLLLRNDVGGVEYDATARLQFGAREARSALTLQADAPPRVELLLRIKGATGDAEEAVEVERVGVSVNELQEAEKEARQVALRLRKLHDEKHLVWDRERRCEHEVEWRDMAVLLRAPSGKAEGWAREFHRAGVPLVVERGGFFENPEVADLLNLLTLLDNPQQDLPLLAVLRSPVVGLSLDELAEIRAAAGGRFWSALIKVRNAECAARKEGLAKARRFLAQFAQWRRLARHVSLSRCLETILHETSYGDWLRGQPRGEQRFGNVQQLLGLAQQFDEFQRQGLFRFLQFIEAQREADVGPDAVTTGGVDAVRLMSIHRSKGLEFPVVALANLDKGFNEQDLRGTMLLDEEFGLCPRIKPPGGGGMYPSLPLWRARRRAKRELWGEELRLLYVAVTRACDTLILSAAVTQKKFDTRWLEPQTDGVAGRELLEARSFADWLGLWFARQTGRQDLLALSTVDDATLSLADTDKTVVLPVEALPELDAAELKKLREVLMWEYPFRAATERGAKTSVTALRRAAEELDEEAQQEVQVSGSEFRVGRRAVKSSKLTTAERGTAHHKYLQHVELAQTGGVTALRGEAERLRAAGVLTADEMGVLDFGALENFWASDIGGRICAQGAAVWRELPFTARFNPAELTETMGLPDAGRMTDEFVVVQGVADLVVLLETEIWLLDFKTDELRAGDLVEKIEAYKPQLKLYALALERIYGKRVTNRWLHFLAAGETSVV